MENLQLENTLISRFFSWGGSQIFSPYIETFHNVTYKDPTPDDMLKEMQFIHEIEFCDLFNLLAILPKELFKHLKTFGFTLRGNAIFIP